MEVIREELIKEKDYKYISGGRVAAIIISEEGLAIGSTHNDCLEQLYYDLGDSEFKELESNTYKHNSNIPIVIGDIFEKVIVLYYYDHLENKKINEILNDYCQRYSYKLFIDKINY